MTIRVEVTTVVRITHETTGTVSAHEATVGEAYEAADERWRDKILKGASVLVSKAEENVLEHVFLDFQEPLDSEDG